VPCIVCAEEEVVTKDDLDLVSTQDLVDALARRADAIVIHIGYELDDNRTSSQPMFAGNIHTCYGLAYDLVTEVEYALMAQREESRVKHDDEEKKEEPEDDEDDDGEGWKKGLGEPACD
jgi:hypothetical protein